MTAITTHGRRALSFEPHPERPGYVIVRLDHHYDRITFDRAREIIATLQQIVDTEQEKE